MVLPGFANGFMGAGAGAYSPEAEAYFAAMTTQPSNARKTLINNLIVGLIADGVWSKLDWLCLMAAHAEQAGRLNAKNPTKALTAFNSPTFTTDLGFTGNGSTSYLSTGEAPSGSGRQYTQNDAHFSVWKNSTNTGSSPDLGGSEANIRLNPNWGGTNGIVRVNTNTDSGLPIASFTKGFACASRYSSGLTRVLVNTYYEGSYNSPSSAITTQTSITILRMQTQYSSSRLSMFSSGGALSEDEMKDLRDRSSTYLTAIGAD